MKKLKLNIEISQTIERTDIGDSIKLQFDNFIRYVKCHITDNLDIEYEVRDGYDPDEDSNHIVNVCDNIKDAIDEAKQQIIQCVEDYVIEHYGIKLS